jgi:uncharacterized membrane protein (DUF485 family)
MRAVGGQNAPETGRTIAHGDKRVAPVSGAFYDAAPLLSVLVPMPSTPASSHPALEALAAARWRIGLGLTAAMTAIYVVFILLVAYGKAFLGTVIAPGLSIGIALGVLVILAAWGLILVYVRWANEHYDREVARIRGGGR